MSAEIAMREGASMLEDLANGAVMSAVLCERPTAR